MPKNDWNDLDLRTKISISDEATCDYNSCFLVIWAISPIYVADTDLSK